MELPSQSHITAGRGLLSTFRELALEESLLLFDYVKPDQSKLCTHDASLHLCVSALILTELASTDDAFEHHQVERSHLHWAIHLSMLLSAPSWDQFQWKKIFRPNLYARRILRMHERRYDLLEPHGLHRPKLTCLQAHVLPCDYSHCFSFPCVCSRFTSVTSFHFLSHSCQRPYHPLFAQ